MRINRYERMVVRMIYKEMIKEIKRIEMWKLKNERKSCYEIIKEMEDKLSKMEKFGETILRCFIFLFD